MAIKRYTNGKNIIEVIDGEQGPKGDRGDTGPIGPQGPQGVAGSPGQVGPRGHDGDTGLQGDTGEKGDKGDPGQDGMDGADGAQGDKGDKGDNGDPGERGEPGRHGVNGRAGKDGQDGKDGKDGQLGPMGPQGLPGGPGSSGGSSYTTSDAKTQIEAYGYQNAIQVDAIVDTILANSGDPYLYDSQIDALISGKADANDSVLTGTTQAEAVECGDSNTHSILAAEPPPGQMFVEGLIEAHSGTLNCCQPWCASTMTLGKDGFGSSAKYGLGTFDLTGGASGEQEFTKTNFLSPSTAWDFVAGDKGKLIILINGTHKYAVARINEVISTTVVLLETAAWDADEATPVEFIKPSTNITFTSPRLKINNIGADAEWENVAINHTGEYANKFETSAAGEDVASAYFETDAAGYNDVSSIKVVHKAGAITSPSVQRAVLIEVNDESSAGIGDINAIRFQRVKGASTSTVDAMHVGTTFTNALYVDGAASANPTKGYSFTAAFAVTDRLAAFTDAATDVQLFTADNTGILIGSASPFSAITCILAIPSNVSIVPIIQYSTGNGTWSTLTCFDGTRGFRESGKISFAMPALWATSNKCNGSTGDIDAAYYVRITRTQNTVSTPPTEDFFKVYNSTSNSDMRIAGNGEVFLPTMSDASASLGAIYIDSATGVPHFKGGTIGVPVYYEMTSV